jgi:hypothetical protein
MYLGTYAQTTYLGFRGESRKRWNIAREAPMPDVLLRNRYVYGKEIESAIAEP